ncbi:MAG: NAD(P)-dependent oxidoreductase [Cyclobacteriaceae bacterium]|nr:NAD(P)-dependent oxidoreductase [Cyclobacteriaceae bacterium]
MRIGILKEGKVPVDKRVAVTPEVAKQLLSQFPNHSLVCQKSEFRCFTDEEYTSVGIEVSDTLEDCDILIGVKEVNVDALLPEKTYLFFSHTIKAQAYNRKLLQNILRKRIRLIDYERLFDENNNRVVAFGRFAGIVGAYNAIWTFGKRYNLFSIRRAHECHDLEDLKSEYQKVILPKIKIALTGGGRVSKGAMEVLFGLGIRKVSPHDFLCNNYEGPVFTQLGNGDYNIHKEGKAYSRSEFYKSPENYKGDFLKFAKAADILIAGAYWDPKAPVLFEREDVLNPNFNIRVIADITCDIEGSIPSTKKPSSIDDPVYDYNASDDVVLPPFIDEENISVMAVDNLPCELPRDASIAFSNDLMRHVFPRLLEEVEDSNNMIGRATIAENGCLTSHFSYLQNFVDGKD